jgi:putative flippase GtrA
VLRAFRPGIVGQGLRFALAGGLVMFVYLTSTIVIADVLGLPFQAALAVGFLLALTLHFTLQRVFVWSSEAGFALPLRRQLPRYLLVALTQYGVTAASTSLLPDALGLPAEVIYLATVLLITGSNFLVFRHGVFHSTPEASGESSRTGSEAADRGGLGLDADGDPPAVRNALSQ